MAVGSRGVYKVTKQETHQRLLLSFKCAQLTINALQFLGSRVVSRAPAADFVDATIPRQDDQHFAARRHGHGLDADRSYILRSEGKREEERTMRAMKVEKEKLLERKRRNILTAPRENDLSY